MIVMREGAPADEAIVSALAKIQRDDAKRRPGTPRPSVRTSSSADTWRPPASSATPRSAKRPRRRRDPESEGPDGVARAGHRVRSSPRRTGMRAGELCGLRIRHLVLDVEDPYVRVTGKGGAVRDCSPRPGSRHDARRVRRQPRRETRRRSRRDDPVWLNNHGNPSRGRLSTTTCGAGTSARGAPPGRKQQPTRSGTRSPCSSSTAASP